MVFILIGIIILLFGLRYQLFDFRSITSAIPAIIITAMLGMAGYLFRQNTHRNEESPKKRVFPSFKKPEFKAKRVNGQQRYIRGSVNIVFHSEYIGKLKNGYFVNEIIFPENKRMNTFTHTINYKGEDALSAKSYCLESIPEPSSKKGVLNGWKKFSYTWNWDIPFQGDMPLGDYKIKMMVFNEGEENPLQTLDDGFEVLNTPDISPYHNVNAKD